MFKWFGVFMTDDRAYNEYQTIAAMVWPVNCW